MSAETEPSPQTSPPVADSTVTPTKHPSLFHTLSYPVSYTVSGLLRRIAADDAPTPLARALSANYNGSMTDPSMGVFQPPKRRLSPFQPPPLTPLTLAGYRESTSHRSRLLNKALAEEIRLLMPPRLQLVDSWKLAYSLEQDGTSLASLYGLCDQYRGKRGGFVITVRDGDGNVSPALLLLCQWRLITDNSHRSSALTSQTHPTSNPTTTAQANVSSGAASDPRLYQISHPSHLHHQKIPPTSAE